MAAPDDESSCAPPSPKKTGEGCRHEQDKKRLSGRVLRLTDTNDSRTDGVRAGIFKKGPNKISGCH